MLYDKKVFILLIYRDIEKNVSINLELLVYIL